MLRRRLFVYTTAFAVGIVCAFIFCEMAKPLWAAALMIAAGSCVCRLPEDRTLTSKERRVLIISIVTGFFTMVVHFIALSSGAAEIADYDLHGVIKTIRYKEYGYEILAVPEDRSVGRYIRIAYVDENHQLEDELDIYGAIGDYITAGGTLRKFEGRDNPGCFDNRLYQASRGVRCGLTSRYIVIDDNDELLHRIHKRIMSARSGFEESFDGEPELRALVKGVVFGDKNEIDEATRDQFNENGTGHILAVSGLHIGFLFSLLSLLLKRRRTSGVNIFIVTVLICYGEMTMWSPSTVRAVMVMAVSLASTRLRRRADLLTSVSFAALVLLISNPYQLFNTGFQMSFLAMLGIAFAAPALSYFVGDYLSVIIAVQLAIAPITAFLFHRVSPLTVFINIPVTLIASVLVPLCIAGIGLIIIIGNMPVLLYQIIAGLLELLLEVNRVLNMKGSWSFDQTVCSSGLLIIFYCLIFAACSEWMRVQLIRKNYDVIKDAVICLIIPGLIMCMATYNQFGDDELVFLSVGQGDSLQIRSGSDDILVDGGGNAECNIGKDILKPYLLANSTPDIDAAVLTHLHTDHYKGIEELSEIYPVREIILSKQYSRSYESEHSNTRFITTADIIQVGEDCYIKPLWPVERSSTGIIASDEANEFNMVFMVYYRGVRVLVTGDLLEEDELHMLQYYSGTDELDCDILKVAHHGSRSSSSEAFLDAVTPDIAIISVGLNNMYGHPHEQTIERLVNRGVKIYRTDYNGAVGIDINRKGNYRIDLMKQQWSNNGI